MNFNEKCKMVSVRKTKFNLNTDISQRNEINYINLQNDQNSILQYSNDFARSNNSHLIFESENEKIKELNIFDNIQASLIFMQAFAFVN